MQVRSKFYLSRHVEHNDKNEYHISKINHFKVFYYIRL
jgi:hypothetical protein